MLEVYATVEYKLYNHTSWHPVEVYSPVSLGIVMKELEDCEDVKEVRVFKDGKEVQGLLKL